VKVRAHLRQFALWVDQGVNVLTGGYADETLSARCYREDLWLRPWINALFFWQRDHCQSAFQNELLRKHLPEVYQ
jgi:hypothetical protein